MALQKCGLNINSGQKDLVPDTHPVTLIIQMTPFCGTGMKK